MTVLWLLLGLILGGVFLAFARALGRAERLVLALGLVLAAVVYVGFALAGAGLMWVLVDALGVIGYGALAWLGLKRSALWLAAGWALHPVWDVGLHIAGSGAAFAPAWYAILCLGFDLLVAGYIVFRFGSVPARSPAQKR